MSLCIQRIQKRGHLKSLFRPPNQGNHGITIRVPVYGKTQQTGQSPSLCLALWGLSTWKEVLHVCQALPTSPILSSPELNFDVANTKKLQLYSISTSVLQGWVPLCTEQKSAARTLAQWLPVWAPIVWGSGPKGRGVLEACAIDIQSHVQNFTSMRVKV